MSDTDGRPYRCPECRFPLFWVPARPPSVCGFCEQCGAFWLHHPQRGTDEVTAAVFAVTAPRMSLADFRADGARGRVARVATVTKLREIMATFEEAGDGDD